MYRRLETRGVQGFHFVVSILESTITAVAHVQSNSPSQLFPSIRRFLTVNEFPSRHSIKVSNAAPSMRGQEADV
jgi:phosphatidate phosphatase APP1